MEHTCEEPELCAVAQRGTVEQTVRRQDEDPWSIEES